jgi:predicted RNA binding protein YcfA (HicA-like mRNA interferase family)
VPLKVGEIIRLIEADGDRAGQAEQGLPIGTERSILKQAGLSRRPE